MFLNGIYIHSLLDKTIETHTFVPTDPFGYMFECSKCNVVIFYGAQSKEIELFTKDADKLTCNEYILKNIL